MIFTFFPFLATLVTGSKRYLTFTVRFTMVAITLTDLRALSIEFNFDYEKAREFLNKNHKKTNHTKTEKICGGTKAYDGTTIPSTKELVALMKPVKNINGGAQITRGKTGYHYYMNEISDNVKKSLLEKTRNTGEKIPRNGVASEVSRKWHALSESKREAWNNYAKSQNAKH